MNTLLYNARMCLRDFMEVNIYSPGDNRVYLSVLPQLVWEGASKSSVNDVFTKILARLHDMELDLKGGEDALENLRDSEPVEIIRRVA